MAESSWPSPSNGRVVDDTQYEKMAVSYGQRAGVIGDFTNPALVYADSTGMQIKVAADRYALVSGHEWWSGSSIFTKAISSNASGSTRVDLVVLRLSRTTWDVNVVVIAGTPGSGAPSPVQNTGTTGSWDLVLATVTVANGAATIAAGNVSYLATHLTTGGNTMVAGFAGLAYAPVKVTSTMCYVTDAGTYAIWNGSAWKWCGDFPINFARVSSLWPNGTTTLQTVPELVLPVTVVSTYHLELGVLYEAPSAVDLRILVRVPSGANFLGLQNVMIPTMASQQDTQIAAWSENSASTWGGAGSGVNLWGWVTGTIQTSNVGNVSIEIAQATSGAGNAILKPGSFMSLRRIG